MEFEGINFAIWGSKGHAIVLEEIIRLRGGAVVALFDQNTPKSVISHAPIYQGEAAFRKWVEENRNSGSHLAAIAAIGGSHGQARLAYLQLFRDTGCLVPSVVHPMAFVADSAVIESNSQILGSAHVGVRVQIGECSIVNTNASVDHECHLGNGVHVAPGATLCGCVTVGSNTLIGAGAVVLPAISIGKNVTVGAGSVVTKDVPDNVITLGNPARVLREKREC